VKKLPLFLFLLCITLFLPAQEEEPEDEDEDVDRGFRFKNRMVELSIADISVNASNSFIAATDVFKNPFYLMWHIRDIIHDPVRMYKDPVVVNLDDLFKGFKFNMRTSIKPLSLNFNWKDNWGIGLNVGHIDAWGNITIPKTVLSLKEAKNEPFGMGGAIFADFGIPVFFHVNDVKIKFKPSVYAPMIYARPGMTYTYKRNYQNPETGVDGSYLEVKYDMRIYTLLDMKKGVMESLKDEGWNIPRKNLGYDFGLNIEYPWDSWIDLGVDFINIPVVRAKLYHYMQMSGSMVVDTSFLDMNSLMSGEISEHLYLLDHDGMSYGKNSKGQKVYRPFTTLFYINYYPLNSYFLCLMPSLGFSINPVYTKIGSVEGGVSVRIDIANMLITTMGINYNNRTWKNSTDFIFNLRAFELNMGMSSQSPSFAKSWQGAGFGVNFGMKFGW